MKTMNKEQIYDIKISPLMAQILEICKTNGIAMLCSFAIPIPEGPDLMCTSRTPNEKGKLPAPLAEASAVIYGNHRSNALMVTTQNKDGQKTITAFLD